MKKYLFLLTAFFSLGLLGFSQTFVDFNSIPKTGTVMVMAHQDDDIIFMLPFMFKSEKFILGTFPSTSEYKLMIHNQQIYLDTNSNSSYKINYESNWVCPWDDISPEEYRNYYLTYSTYKPYYDYLAADHINTSQDYVRDNRSEVVRMKAKLEPYIADVKTSRVITMDIWGEYDNEHHKALNLAIRELAVKYRKDVWMLGCTVSEVTGLFTNVPLPQDISYTNGNFDLTFYNAIKNIYKDPRNYLWTWTVDHNPPSGDRPFIKIVDAGVDKIHSFSWKQPTISGPMQDKPGAYIFNGTEDYLTLPGNNYSAFTIGMWIKPDVIKAMDISKMTEYPSSPTCDRSLYMQSDGKVTARIFNGQSSQTITTQSALITSAWSHILITGNGSSLQIYFNGVLQGEISTGALYSLYTTPEFVIGQAQETASFFKGQISDVRLYDYVLTADEITSVSSAAPPAVHTITASANHGGAITPPDAVIMNHGSSRVYTITHDNNYRISDVKVDNISVGPVSSYTFSNITANHTIVASFVKAYDNIALNKPVFYDPARAVSGHEATKANDADGTNASYWEGPVNEGWWVQPPAIPTTPYNQWWEVDLGSNYDVTNVVIRNYVYSNDYSSDSFRFYYYEIWGSTDNTTFTKIVDKTNNIAATDAGESYDVNIKARYLKVIINYCSSKDPGVRISDFRAYGTLNTSTWTGASDNNWFNTANWTGEVPSASKNVLIPYVVNYPVISASAVCNNLTINASAKLEIATNGSLSVNGILTNYSGIFGLVIKSDASGTGSLIENSGAAATIERYIANNWNWHLISSPSANQAIWPQFAPAPSLISSKYKFPASPWYWDFYYFNPNCPPTGTSWVNLRKNNNGDYNDQSVYAGNGFGGFNDASSTFPPRFERGEGYLVAYTNGWNSSSETHSFSGFCNTGPINRLIINNSSGSKFNLVGNPYPSSIDWDMADGPSSWGRSNALDVSGLGYDYWVWKDAIGQYLYRNSASTLGTAGKFIEPGQGFFVQAKANPNSLTFNNGIRTHNSDKGWVKSNSSGIYTLRLKLSTDANSFFDEMFLDFNTAYSGLEGTPKFMSLYTEAPEIYSVKEGSNFSIDRYQQLSDDLTVNISTKCGVAGNYTITSSNVSGFVLSKKVYLEDLKTGNKINLKENNSYSFTSNPNDISARFKLTFSESTGLPEQEAVKQVYVHSIGKDIYINSTLPNIGNCDVIVYDVIGHIVYRDSYEPGKDNSKFTTLNVIPGTYFVKVISQTGSSTVKIIIL